MRLLLVNPNSNATLTARLREAIAPRLAVGDTLACHTADDGPEFIGSHATIAAARQRLEEELPSLADDYDAVFLGCFGDLGIETVKQRLGSPVVSLWDACVAVARTNNTRIGLLTTSTFWVEQLRLLVGENGLSKRIPAVSTVALPLVPDPRELVTGLRSAIAAARRQGGFDAIALGGALLAAAAPALGPTDMPVLDLIGVALSMCRNPNAILLQT